MGSRVSGLAYRVFGDEHEVPRRALRPAHRRCRQHLPAPRGRDRAVRRSVRPRIGPSLGARAASALRRREDGEVGAQHGDDRRADRARDRSARLPVPVPADALPHAHALLARRAATGRRSARSPSSTRPPLVTGAPRRTDPSRASRALARAVRSRTGRRSESPGRARVASALRGRSDDLRYGASRRVPRGG